jgi:hypothetical protein
MITLNFLLFSKGIVDFSSSFILYIIKVALESFISFMTYKMNMVVQYSKKQQNEIMDMLHVLCYTLQKKKNQTAAFFLCILLNNESSN